MASIDFVVKLSSGDTFTKTAEIADGVADRLVAWALYAFPQDVVDGNPVPRDSAWAVGKWIDDVVKQTFAKIHDYEKDVAAAAMSSVKRIAVVMK